MVVDRFIKVYLPHVGICLMMQVGIVGTGLLLQQLLTPQDQLPSGCSQATVQADHLAADEVGGVGCQE